MGRSAANGKLTETTAEDLTAQINVLRDDISALTESMGNYGKAQVAELGEAAKGQAAKAKSNAQDAAEAIKAQASDLNGQASAFVAARPATALGIAAGLGFLVGMLSSRK